MDNNHDSQRHRKRVTRETLRKRQLTALFVIALVVLILIVLIAKGCSKDNKNGGGNSSAVTTTTTTVTTPTMIITEAPTTTVAPTTDTGGFKLDKYSIYLEVGGQDMPFVQEYPEGSGESDESWSSENTSVATVDDYGHITAVTPGETYIILKSAADPTKSVQVKVKVAEAGSPIDSSSETTTAATTVVGGVEPTTLAGNPAV